ncbi:MAG TPA: hypothetical protein VIH99_11520, partial [Bdellovibrionota bacterium]
MYLRKSIALLTVLFLVGISPSHAAQLTYGRYYGTIQMEGQPYEIAVSMDAFIVQLKGPSTYPALEVIVRANLGGYSGSEYFGYHYLDPTFNFEKSILELNDPHDDLTATLKVTNTESETILEGPVLHRLTNSKGTMRLKMEIDGQILPSASQRPLLNSLKGEYVGKCGADLAKLQIETARGLESGQPGNALLGYSITGRLGFPNGPNCYPDKTHTFCSLYTYSSGSYSPFSNRLTMQGKFGTIDCSKSGETFHCKVFGYDKSGSCDLTKKPEPPTAPVQAPASFFLEVT